jgi:hypothetical protein
MKRLPRAPTRKERGMATTTVYDWGQAVMTSTATALALFLSAIPKLIGFAAILIIGWLIAGALTGLTARLLRLVRFNDLAERSGLSGFVRNMGVYTDASGVMATVVNWFLRLIVLVVAFDALGLAAVSDVLRQFLLWIPNLFVALVVLVIAGLLANVVYRLVRGAMAEAGFDHPEMLGTIARFAVWAFGIVIAVNQIGVATTLVNTLFMGIVAALALGFGLAFGLGGRDTAGEIVRDCYRGLRQTGPRITQAADAAGRQTQSMRSDPDAGPARPNSRVS